METLNEAHKHLGGRAAGRKEAFLVWNTSLKTAVSTPGARVWESQGAGGNGWALKA